MQNLFETLFQRGFLVVGPYAESPENTYFRCTFRYEVLRINPKTKSRNGCNEKS